ncbi:MAG TPA: molybdopterin cofactor-binding domain-containing protein, partial [Thermoanaerobaculia bacterium]|nr:molybdopterin cofactor-binding domain-containing protein [Thermoanaerobaculia bacterium]
QHASVHAMRGAIDANGSVIRWSHKKISNPVMTIDDPPTSADTADLAAFYQDSAWGTFDIPYAIPNLETSYVRVDAPIRYGPWRAVYAPSSVFARESFVDELAHAAKRDPLQMRLDLLRGDDVIKAGSLTIDRRRLRHVLEAVRERSGWGDGRPRGVACNVYDGETTIAYVAEISLDAKKVFRVDRIVCAVDCGPVVNPIGVEQQVEGGVIWALAQLRNQVTIRRGAVQQSTYRDYPVPRIDDAPRIETHILPTLDVRPTGMGEPPVPPLVPAVLNAYFALSGVRVRRLPL